ncbi:MAG: ribonuclease D [Glaciecola sp.]|jgi:ribonuclease D
MTKRTTFIDDPEHLVEALEELTDPVLGCDVERADADNYFRRAALVQLGDAEHVLLVDAVALPSLPAMHRHLLGHTTILHAIENDIVPLDAADVLLEGVADTSIAAALLGLPTGLDPLLQELMGVSLSPDKEKFQRADWTMRPLPDDMAAYAADDVFHLPALWALLEERLDEAGRRSWYDQELEAVVERARQDTRDWTRTRGMGKLSPEERLVLRALWDEREAISREGNIAPSRVLREETLVKLAQEPARNVGDLVRRNQRRRRPTDEQAERLFDAQVRGADAEPEPKPDRSRTWDPSDRKVYDSLRKRRATVADELGIDSGVLAPSKPLWDAVVADPEGGEELCLAAGMRQWQVEVLAEPLWETYVATRERAATPVTDDENLDEAAAS